MRLFIPPFASRQVGKTDEQFIGNNWTREVSYRKTLVTLSKILIPLLQNFAQNEEPSEFTEAARSLCEILESGESIRLLTTAELIILSKMIQALPASPLLEINIPFEKGFLSREDLRFQMTEWIDELPGEPCLLKF